MKIAADDKIPFLRGVFEEYGIDMLYKKGAEISPSDLIDADALIVRTRTACNRKLLENSKVRAVATATIGTDHVNIAELAAMGIDFFSAPGCNAMSVQQYIVCALLYLAKKHELNLAGMTLGIIGVGNVGKCVQKAAENMGMNVLLNDPPRAAKEGHEKFTELNELLEKADFVTMHVPLVDDTYHLADAEFFGRMKRSAFFINSSRGSVCNNAVLKNVLCQKQIAGAVLDVWEKEPDIDLELQNMLELGTMHIAGYSADGKANGTSQSVRNIANFFNISELKNFSADIADTENSKVLTLEGNNPQKVLSIAAKAAYDIGRDSRSLLEHPENFEKLRGNYYCRREFHAWGVSAQGLDNKSVELLKKMNFKIKE